MLYCTLKASSRDEGCGCPDILWDPGGAPRLHNLPLPRMFGDAKNDRRHQGLEEDDDRGKDKVEGWKR